MFRRSMSSKSSWLSVSIGRGVVLIRQYLDIYEGATWISLCFPRELTTGSDGRLLPGVGVSRLSTISYPRPLLLQANGSMTAMPATPSPCGIETRDRSPREVPNRWAGRAGCGRAGLNSKGLSNFILLTSKDYPSS